MYIAPSSPPESITEISSSPFNITIAWQPVDCKFRNGNITGYVIRYSEAGIIIDGNTTKMSYTVTDLFPTNNYSIEVAGINRAGIGKFGNITVSTALCKLMCLVICSNQTLPYFNAVKFSTSMSSTVINITWPQVSHDVLITWNKISCNMCTELNFTAVESFTSLHGQTFYSISDLEPFTDYNVTVCIINGSICASEIVMTKSAGMIQQLMYAHDFFILPTYYPFIASPNMPPTAAIPSTSQTIAAPSPSFPSSSEPTSPPTIEEDAGESSSDIGGAVSGVVVSLFLIIVATVGIITVVWLLRRYNTGHRPSYTRQTFGFSCFLCVV